MVEREKMWMYVAIILALALLASMIFLGARAGVLTQTVTQTQTLTQPVTITQTRTETMTQTQTITQTQVLTMTQTTTQTITPTRDIGIIYISEPIRFSLYKEQYWEYYYKVKVASLSTFTIVLRSSYDPMKVKIDVNGKTLYYDDKTYNVNFKHNLEPGEYTIWLWVLCPYGIKITVEGELKIESIR